MRTGWRLASQACLCLLLSGCGQGPPAGTATAGDTLGAAAAQAPDLQAVARNLVLAAGVKWGDRVMIGGSVRDAALMEDAAIEVMKAGGQPLIALGSEQLARRSYDEVPAAYDTIKHTLDLALINAFDVSIEIDVGETEGLLAGVPMARRVARGKASEPVTAALLKRNLRTVNLGNGVYPTAPLAKRLGIGQADLAAVFWKAAAVPPESLRTRGEALRSAIAAAKLITLTQANGTSLTVGLDADRAILSDGVVRPGKALQATWLPAGELVLPATAGTAEGKVVIDKLLWDGREIPNLTLTYSKGRLVSMTADSGIAGLKEAYDAAGGAKDLFGYVDIGLNPANTLPLGTGRIIWTAPGAVTVGLGENRFYGGTNASDFSLATQLGAVTLKADTTTIIADGVLK